MARNISKRVDQLQKRRRGTDRFIVLNDAARSDVLQKSLQSERWEERGSGSQIYTRYALGAMQEVGPDYTRISIETAERVGRQLDSQISYLEFRLQGSVPLNVHIRGVSDVDLLVLENSFLTYSPAGVKSQAGHYSPFSSPTAVQKLMSLRTSCERILSDSFPAATVDTSGSKAVHIYGGSLARPVDVVPAHWFDTIEYQASERERDRAVSILDKSVPATINNWPFLHIGRISDADNGLHGCLRKAIRLCKNVKADAEEDGTVIGLSSYDIGATMFHANYSALQVGLVYELAILAETQRHLDALTTNEAAATALMTPDGSRKIFDTPERLRGLRALSIEMDDLAREVAKEHAPLLGNPTLQESRTTMSSVFL